MSRWIRLLLISVWLVHLHGCTGSSNSDPTPVNATPMANADVGSSENGNAVTLAVLANDSSPVGSPLQISAFTRPAHGLVTVGNGALTYVPDAGFFGQDQFSYTLSDSANRSASTQVVIQSRIRLNLRGVVEGNVVGAQLRLSSNEPAASFSGVGGTFLIDLDTTNADIIVRLDAQGSGSDSFIRFAVLLGTARELLATARVLDLQSAIPTLTAERYPRLNLGVLGTAEYGSLRELVSAEDLLNAGRLRGLRAFVDAESMLLRAVLIGRAVSNPLWRSTPDSLVLASDPFALERLRNPTGAIGSGSIANISALVSATNALRSNSAYYSAIQPLPEGVSWIGPVRANDRLFLANRWSGDRLDNHERRRIGAGSAGAQRRSLSTAVQVLRTAQHTMMSAPEGGNLGDQFECDAAFASCQERSHNTSLTLRPFFDHYLRVTTFAVFPALNFTGIDSDNLATRAPDYARNLPARLSLSLCVRCTESNEQWVTAPVRFDPDGRYTQILESQPGSPPAVSGRWEARAGKGPMLVDEVSGDQHFIDWVADFSGRGLAIVTTHSASGGTRVVLSEWVEL